VRDSPQSFTITWNDVFRETIEFLALVRAVVALLTLGTEDAAHGIATVGDLISALIFSNRE